MCTSINKYNVQSIHLLITNACNCRCLMCNIWKESPVIHISEGVILALSKIVTSPLEFIAISGGEVLLHPQFEKIVAFVLSKLSPKMAILCTNGTNPRKLYEMLVKFPELIPSISYDGVKSHNRIRGRHDADRLVRKVVALLKPLSRRKILSFTCQKENQNEVLETFYFAQEHGFEFDFRLVEEIKLYGVGELDRGKQLDTVLKELISLEKDLAKKLFYHGYLQRESPINPCLAGKRFIYVMPNGDIYPCLDWGTRIGTVWTGIKKEVVCNKNCWVDCYFYDNYHTLLTSLDCQDTNTKGIK